MKKILLILVVLLFSSVSFGQEKWGRYKDGTFKLVDKVRNETHIIKRKGNIQSEEVEGTTLKYDFEVKWINDCSYTLHPTEDTIKLLKVDYTLIVEIAEIKGNMLMLKMFSKESPDSIISVEVEAIN